MIHKGPRQRTVTTQCEPRTPTAAQASNDASIHHVPASVYPTPSLSPPNPPSSNQRASHLPRVGRAGSGSRSGSRPRPRARVRVELASVALAAAAAAAAAANKRLCASFGDARARLRPSPARWPTTPPATCVRFYIPSQDMRRPSHTGTASWF
eukprot:scaffold1687_cov405-Prasinococcus_capsulatus_cf.AAC.10